MTTNYEQYRANDGYFYYTYKITLTEGALKNHYYLGLHKTKNINDNYKGSGKIVKEYYKKHPDDYIKEILNFYESLNDVHYAEKELIGNKHITDKLCLNLNPGGFLTEEQLQKAKQSLKGRKPWDTGKHLSKETRMKISNAHKGRKDTEETRLHKSIAQQNNNYIRKHIYQYSLDGKFIREFNSIREAGDITGVYFTNIKANLQCRTHYAGGFIWKYKNHEDNLFYLNRSNVKQKWDFYNWKPGDDLIELNS